MQLAMRTSWEQAVHVASSHSRHKHCKRAATSDQRPAQHLFHQAAQPGACGMLLAGCLPAVKACAHSHDHRPSLGRLARSPVSRRMSATQTLRRGSSESTELNCTASVERHETRNSSLAEQEPLCYVICGVSGSGKRCLTCKARSKRSPALTTWLLQHCGQAAVRPSAVSLLRRR